MKYQNTKSVMVPSCVLTTEKYNYLNHITNSSTTDINLNIFDQPMLHPSQWCQVMISFAGWPFHLSFPELSQRREVAGDVSMNTLICSGMYFFFPLNSHKSHLPWIQADYICRPPRMSCLQCFQNHISSTWYYKEYLNDLCLIPASIRLKRKLCCRTNCPQSAKFSSSEAFHLMPSNIFGSAFASLSAHRVHSSKDRHWRERGMAGFPHSRVAQKASEFYSSVMVNKNQRILGALALLFLQSVRQFTTGKGL